jgi:hypothetical protein
MVFSRAGWAKAGMDGYLCGDTAADWMNWLSGLGERYDEVTAAEIAHKAGQPELVNWLRDATSAR